MPAKERTMLLLLLLEMSFFVRILLGYNELGKVVVRFEFDSLEILQLVDGGSVCSENVGHELVGEGGMFLILQVDPFQVLSERSIIFAILGDFLGTGELMEDKDHLVDVFVLLVDLLGFVDVLPFEFGFLDVVQIPSFLPDFSLLQKEGGERLYHCSRPI